ncbi:MAG: cell division protein FtsW [Myxococcales bacterium]|nr:cell division protein FtsW [Myxococcales bacterium]MCB9670972.1 cell division protein FtsW [Alphaproteobacteria bacterium]
MDEQLHKLTRIDWPLAVIYGLLAGLGVLMILSASSLEADARYGDAFRFVVRQVAGIGVGLTLTTAILLTPIRVLRRLVWPAYVTSLLSLLMVLTPLAHTANGATRWFRLGPVNVQPSEFMKIALVVGLAHYLSINQGKLRDHAVLAVSVVLLALPLVFMLPQKDFGTTVILIGLAGVLLFVAGLPWRWLFTLGGAAGAGLAVLIAVEPYRMVRLISFTDPFKDQSGAGYQVVQGWIALATGGLFGQGLASGVAQRGFLPEAHTDFISAVVGEELGAVGWSIMVLLFLALVWRALVIASRSQDLFCMLVAVGLASLVGAQCVINLGVVGGLMPNKGLVLPFMSYGASAAMAHSLVVGLLLRVSMEGAVSSELDMEQLVPVG